jgi:hypothetical protein
MCLYNIEWQTLRVSFLGKWNAYDSARANLLQGLEYITAASDLNEQYTRLWRMVNLLNAVRMGYSGQNRLDSDVALMVAQWRDKWSNGLYELKRQGADYVVDSDDKIREDWAKLEFRVQKAIASNLNGRLDLHKESKHRNELRHFLFLIGEMKEDVDVAKLV